MANYREIFFKDRQQGKKLDIARVKKLLEEWRKGATTSELATRYGIGTWMVSSIKRGNSWWFINDPNSPRRVPRKKYPKKPNSKKINSGCLKKKSPKNRNDNTSEQKL